MKTLLTFFTYSKAAQPCSPAASSPALRSSLPERLRGVSIEGGTRQELRAGDTAHVPAGLPHQMLVSGDKSITCLVVKIQENP